MINTLKQVPPKKSGFTVLLLAVVLLIISTLLIFFTAQYSSLQQKITSNYYKSEQALQAAQAGVEAAIPYLQANYTAITANSSGGYLLPYNNSSTQNVTLTNGSTYSFTYSNPTANSYQLITITSTGHNTDNSATTTITQQIGAYAYSLVPPTKSLSTQGNVSLKDNSSLINSSTNQNINAGGDISLKNNANTRTNSGVSSTSSGLGSDVQANVSSLANMTTDQFLTSTVGVNQSTLQSMANYTFTNSGNTNYSSALNGIKSSVIWINQLNSNALIDNNTVIGSATNPVIIVINGGRLQLKDNVVIYGIVISINPTSNSKDQLKDNTVINGAILSSRDVNMSDNSKVNFNTSILNSVPGGTPSYAKLPGSWRDF
jgi:Tfp pilus assembly protein PilX